MALAAKGFGKLGASSADGSDEREVSGAQTIVSAQEKPSFFPSDFTSAALDAREPYDFEIDHPLTVLSDTLLKRLTRMRRYAMLGLPQSRALNAEAVAQWFNGMAAQELALSAHENKIVQNITWHVKRATGFGGSESGTLVMGSRGAFMPFSSPRSIVSEKLFMIMPQSDGFDLKRGRLLEPVARQLFEVEHPELRRADDLIKLMKDYRHSACPSMIGNPDDIFRSDDGSILIPDYKCPRPREKFKAKPTLRGNDGETLADDDVQWYAYVCQLHHYRELLIDAMRANGLYVPYVAMSLVQFNAWNGDVIVDRIPHDPGIDIEIKACHETFWHNVVSASLPRFSERQRVTEALDLNGDEARAQQLSEERCLWSKIADEAKDKADACRDELMEIVGKYTVPGGKLSIGPVNIGIKEEINEDAVRTELARCAVDLETVSVPATEFDAATAARMIGDWAADAGRIDELDEEERKTAISDLIETIAGSAAPCKTGMLDIEALEKRFTDLLARARWLVGKKPENKTTQKFIADLADFEPPKITLTLDADAALKAIAMAGGNVDCLKKTVYRVNTARNEEVTKLLTGIMTVVAPRLENLVQEARVMDVIEEIPDEMENKQPVKAAELSF